MLPIKTLGCIIAPKPITAVSDILFLEAINGLKLIVNLLKSRKGSSEIKSDYPSGQSTLLLINIVVAADSRAFL